MKKQFSKKQKGFTLIETLAAVTLLSVAIVAPMMLTVRSFTSAFYARDEMTAYYLAEEGIEVVHQARDNAILQVAEGGSANLFASISTHVGTTFTVDTTKDPSDINAFIACISTNGLECQPLLTDGTLYGYASTFGAGSPTATNYTRFMTACYVHPDPGNPGDASTDCNTTPSDEVRITSTVKWRTANLSTQQVMITEDLYKWLTS